MEAIAMKAVDMLMTDPLSGEVSRIPGKITGQVTGIRIELESGAKFLISVSSLQERNDCLEIQTSHPGHIAIACVVPERQSSIKVKPLVVD